MSNFDSTQTERGTNISSGANHNLAAHTVSTGTINQARGDEEQAFKPHQVIFKNEVPERLAKLIEERKGGQACPDESGRIAQDGIERL